jgi:hypothetical protein
VATAGRTTSWSRFVVLFLAILTGGLVPIYLFVLLVDPYDLVPFSLPIERPIVSGNQRHAYAQIARSRRFDAVIMGTSTSVLLDPRAFNAAFDARFANLAMMDMHAWEQKTVLGYYLRHNPAPKVVIVALDRFWCELNADRDRISPLGHFPEWLYDDNPWNDYLYLLNSSTVAIAARIVEYRYGLYRERIRPDGYSPFTPPDNQYDPVRARHRINTGAVDVKQPPGAALSDSERQALVFPALPWLDEVLARPPRSTLKVLAYMPVHVQAQPRPGSRAAAIESECKERIAAIARNRGVTVIDWRIASAITTDDMNYWDSLHYRQQIAQRIARDLAAAVLEHREAKDGSYRLVLQ